MRLDHLLSMETGTDFHGSVIRVNDETGACTQSMELLLFNLQGSGKRKLEGSLEKQEPMEMGV